MLAYISMRLLTGLITLLAVTVIVFGLLNLVPGDPVASLLEGAAYSQQDADRIRQQLGLDRPLPERYARWLLDISRFEFGHSLKTGQATTTVVGRGFPVTLELTAFAITLTALVGVSFGVWSAVRQDRADDHLLRLASILGLSVPSFWLGTMVIVLPAMWFGWVPPLFYQRPSEDLAANLSIMVIPALILAANGSATLMRITRSAMLDVLREDYVRTARAKGLSGLTVIRRHAVRNALLPVLTVLGGQLAFLLSGAVVIETIFNLPGLGRVLVTALGNRDYPVIQAVNLLIAVAVVGTNLLVDLLYRVIDPRIAY